MKCTATLTLALAAIVLAKPMPAKGKSNAANAGNAQQVSSAIDSWLQDIKDVNTFVDTAANLKNAQDISDAAATAFVAAQDEGTQNDNLAKLANLDASGLAANQDLLNQFNIIGPAINDTISNPQNLQKNLDAINGARYDYPSCASFLNYPCKSTLANNVNYSCPPPVGNGAIFEEGAVQQSAALDAGVQAALPELPDACGQLAQAALAAAAN